MKKIYLALGLYFALISISYADDWDLLQPHKESFYCVERNATALTSRYEVDSIKFNSDETKTYFINMKYRKSLFESCPEWNGNFIYDEPGATDYLSIDSLHISEGVNTITYGDDTLRIDQYAEVGESLIAGFFSVSCFQKDMATFLGTTDSVKLYSLSYDTYQDTIVLSKNYGLIESPYFFDLLNPMPEISRLLLSGTEIDGAFAGNKSKDIIEFLPYQIGDDIDMVYTTNSYFPNFITSEDYINTSITDVQQSADELLLYINQDKTSITTDTVNNTSDTTVHPTLIDTITYNLDALQNGMDYDIHYYILGLPNISLFSYSGSFSQNYLAKVEEAYDFYLQKEKLLYTYTGTTLFSQSCEIATISDSWQQIGLTHCFGETDLSTQSFGNSFLELTNPPSSSSNCSNYLSYCVEAPWEILVTNEVDQQEFHGLSLYPNPANENLSVDTHGLEVQSIELRDMNGRKLMHLPSTERSIDISTLASGLYYILVEHRDGNSVEKFTKL